MDKYNKNKYLKMIGIFTVLLYMLKKKKQYEKTIEQYKIKAETVEIINDKFKKEFEKAIKKEEIQVYLQPKFNAQTELIEGAEALARWQKNNKIITPAEFIPKLEKQGLIIKLDQYILEKVCKKQKQWREKGYRNIRISVNESKDNFYYKNHIKELKKLVEKYDVIPNTIELEMTESAVIDNVQLARKAAIDVKELGFIVSMDDFGTGYSSFSMLKDIPIDVLKIDKEFFREIVNNERGKAIIESIILMTKRLNIETVAEGIETREQVEYLKKIQCDMIQGFYFAKPIPIEEFEQKWLNKTKNVKK